MEIGRQVGTSEEQVCTIRLIILDRGDICVSIARRFEWEENCAGISIPLRS